MASEDPASDDPIPDDPIPDDIDEPEADLLPDDPAERLGPDAPRIPDTSQRDAPADLKKQFWSLVLLFNVALFGMSLGAMLVGFESRWRVGGAIFAVGAFAFVRGWRGYQRATSEGWETDDANELDGEADATTGGETTADADEQTTDDEAETDAEGAGVRKD